MVQSDVKVFVVNEPDGHQRIAVGKTLADGFKKTIPERWMAYRRQGVIKVYSLREWFMKASKGANNAGQ